MTTDDIKNAMYATFGPERLDASALSGDDAEDDLEMLAAQIEMGNTTPIPQLLHDFFGVDADDDDADRLAKKYRQEAATDRLAVVLVKDRKRMALSRREAVDLIGELAEAVALPERRGTVEIDMAE